VNQSSERTCDRGQNKLYEFCYLFSFDMWTFYLTRIIFIREYDNLFWEFSNFIRIFNELKHNFQEWQRFINVPESFSYKDFLFILATQEKRAGTIWWQINYFYYFLSCLGLIKTLFWAKIQCFFGSGYGFLIYGFWVSSTHNGRSIGVNF
jgi:hypothetical protein